METGPAMIRTVEHGDPSDLPETNWFWRRLYVYVFTVAAFGLAYWVTYKVTDVTTLRMIARYAILTAGFFALIYVVGSGSEAITRLFAVLRSTRKETVTSPVEVLPPLSAHPEKTATTLSTRAPVPVVDPALYSGPRE